MSPGILLATYLPRSGAVFLPCYLFGLGISHWSYRLLVGGMPKWWPPWDPMLMSIPRISTTSVLVPTVSYSLPPPLQETMQDHQLCLVRFLQSRVTALPWVPVHMKTCMHPPRVDSLFFPALWSSCTQALLVFKVRCSRGSSSSWQQTPSLGSLLWSSEHSFLWDKLCNIIIF